MKEKQEPPEVANYYAALGVGQDATSGEVKKAFRILALKHHADKLAPGQMIDAVQFRQVSLRLATRHMYC